VKALPEEPARGRIADLPLAERRRLDVEKQRELEDGLTRRHLHIATYQRQYIAAQFARVLSIGKRWG
jgi:hypothetical protein